MGDIDMVERELRRQDKRVGDLEQQRDMLRDALVNVMEFGNDEHAKKRAAWAMEKARAALKECE